MTALTGDRNTQRIAGDIRQGAVAAAVKIFAGAMVMRDASGNLTKGQTAVGLRGAGMATEQVDNSAGGAGDLNINFRTGIFRFANSTAGDEITAAEIGKVCYAVDDATVAKTSGPDTRSPAGIVAGVDESGVHVEFDEGDLAVYLANRRKFVPVRVATLVGAGVYRQLSIFAGRGVKIWSVTEGVLTTGDATLAAKINGVAITSGVITITQAASAAGDKDSCVPTAANVVAVGDELSLTVGGSNATATVANCLFEIEID
jgi:hypothetical protein